MTPNSPASLDAVFHALADSSRRIMIDRLTKGPASVSELARPLSMSMPAVFQHLQVLEAAALITTEKTGRVRTCKLNVNAISQAENWVSGRRRAWQSRLDRLGHYLDQLPGDDS